MSGQDEARRAEQNPALAPAVLTGAQEEQQTYAFLYREPAAARVIYRLLWLQLVSLLVILGLAGGGFYLYQRRPERVLIKESANGEQVLQVDNRSYGQIANLVLEPDRPTKGQAEFAAKQFVHYLYEVDLSVRPRQLEKALGLMLPQPAQTVFRYLKDNPTLTNNKIGIGLQQERAEGWTATFTIKDLAQDNKDRLQFNMFGEQGIRKTVNGQSVEETRQIQLTVRLQPDTEGRNDANLQTGFKVSAFTFKEIPR